LYLAAGLVVAGVIATIFSPWPALAIAITAVAFVVVLAFTVPEYAFVVSVLLFACEGSLKAFLAHEGTPLAASTDSVGAGLLDLCLVISFLALAVRDHLRRSLRDFWRGSSTFGRIAITLLAIWVATSAIQALTIGSIRQSLDGLRLVQFYAVVGMLGGLMLAVVIRGKIVWLLLGGLMAISGYAVLRVIIGPSRVEHAYTVSRAGVETYGGVRRAAGSFSAAAGLASYLVPAAVFAFVVVLALPRYRILAGAVLGCTVVAIIASDVRVGIVALAAGLAFSTALLMAQRRWTRRHRFAFLLGIALVFAVGAAGTLIAAHMSSDLSARARVFVHPLSDKSLQLRFDTWKAAVHELHRHPLGTGIGSAGRANEREHRQHVVVDNSFLLLLREQGWPGGLAFTVGIALLVFELARATLDRRRLAHPVLVGALGATFSFLILGLAGEYIEQPGKVLAWMFLGVAMLGLVGSTPRERTYLHSES
jgi:O-Antigen ligase